MDVLIVQGGTPLSGRVAVSGSKNAALPMMATSLLTPGQTILKRVPDLVDVRTLAGLLRSLGCEVTRNSTGDLILDVIDEQHSEADYALVRRMRASVCVLGPLLARRGYARVSLPGGCNIGHRPIDIHLRGFSSLGANVDIVRGDVIVRAKRLYGTQINLAGPHGSTVTGTCNLLSAAVLARGKTILTSAAMEPEVVALAEFLIAMGADISGHGTSVIEINGVEELRPSTGTVIPDRIEAATLMVAAVMAGGELTIDEVDSRQLVSVIEILREMGVRIIETECNNQLSVHAVAGLSPVNVTALPYPGIPTDLQAQLTALLCTVPGTSRVRDLVFPDRFMHCAELNRMGAQICHLGDHAEINGVSRLQGANVMASDLRASAALVLAALAAEGETIVHRVYHLDRGYEALELKLNSLGANIIRCPEDELMSRQVVPPTSLRRSA